MIVSQEIARQIASGKRQMLRVPRTGGKCPYREQHAYVIQHAPGQTSCHVTILNASAAMFEDQPVWVLRFKKGDHTDKPRLLAARPGHEGDIEGDYVDVPARAMRSAGEEVSAARQAKFALDAKARRTEMLSEPRKRALDALRDLKACSPTAKAQKRLRSAEYQIEAATDTAA